MMNFSTKRFIFPPDVIETDQWIVWKEDKRDGKWTKVPVDPNATHKTGRTNDPSSWTSFEDADAISQTNDEFGLGFVFTEDDPFMGIDLDDVRDPETGEVDEDARFIVETMNSYTELSPSGTGYHIIAKGKMPEGRKRKGKIEMYDSGRFFTMTANHVQGSPQEAKVRTQQIKRVHQGFLAREQQEDDEWEFVPSGGVGANLPDEKVIENAKKSSRGEKFMDLYNGNWQPYGYESQSEADLAFACMLAFWTGGDKNQVHRIFKKSDLYRDKWEKKHFSDGSSYGEKTVEKAINNQSDFYGA